MPVYIGIMYFFIYGFLGWCAEVAFAAAKQRKFVNRGFLNGPLCPVYGFGVGAVVGLLAPVKDRLLVLYIASTVVVTLIEWATGFLLDKLFHHKWWDYSGRPLNIGGYVCVLFSLIWGAACVLIVKIIHPLIKRAATALPEALGIVMVAVLAALLAADVYVTVTGILKLNRRLEMMERLASELKELSDKVGTNIYENVENVLETVKAQEEQVEELKKKYKELAGKRTKVGDRLLRAFPKMESRYHKEVLEEIKAMMRRGRK